MDELDLGLKNPVGGHREGIAGLGRNGQGVPAIVDFQAAFGAVVAVQSGAHYHGVDVAASGGGERPIEPVAVAVEFYPAGASAFEAQVETIDVAVQFGMADEETDALGLPIGQRRAVQVIAHLETLDRSIEPRCYRAGPGLIQVFAIDPAPTCAERAVLREQALVALTVMERAQGHQGQLCRRRGSTDQVGTSGRYRAMGAAPGTAAGNTGNVGLDAATGPATTVERRYQLFALPLTPPLNRR